jgi:hypothetical protein
MQLKSYDSILAKLRTSTEPLSIDRQKKLADLLEQFRTLHDNVLWNDHFIEVETKPDKVYLNPKKVKSIAQSQALKELEEKYKNIPSDPLPWETK